MSLETRVLPDNWKVGVVVHTFKKGSKVKSENCRSISLLPVFAKDTEKIMKMKLLKYWNINNILGKNLYGFRQSLSTETARIDVMDVISNNINDNTRVSGLLLKRKHLTQ